MIFNQLDFDKIKLKPIKRRVDRGIGSLAEILNKEYDRLIIEMNNKEEIRQTIKFSIEQQKREKHHKEAAYSEKKESKYYTKTDDDKPRFNLYKYYATALKKNKAYSYFSSGSYSIPGISIVRVPSAILGNNVLGCAFLGRNLIYIREDLHGNDFEEVKKHEVNHILYPHLNEWQIRDKTRAELPFYGRYH